MALKNITPSMTSNTTPSPYAVSASSVNSATGIAIYKAFLTNKENDFGYATPPSNVTCWVMMDFGSSVKVDAFTMQKRYVTGATTSEATAINQTPKDFKLYGSNDKVQFDLLYESTNEIQWSGEEIRLYRLKSQVNYRYYKLQVTANNGSSSATVTAFKGVNFYQDDGITPTINRKNANRIYGQPHATKLRLDNLTSDYRYVIAVEDDGENEGTIRVINHAGKAVVAMAGQKIDLIFNGVAGSVGNYILSSPITKYKSIRIVADLYSATVHKNSMTQDKTVDNTLIGRTGNDISFSCAPTSSIYRYLSINFPDEHSFIVNEMIKGDGNPCIEKIYGIY